MRECKKIKELIWLFIYNEITQQEKEELEKHLLECAECQLDFEESNKAYHQFDYKLRMAPTEFQIEKSRAELHQHLIFYKQNKLKYRWIDKIWNIVSLEFMPSVRFAAVVLVFIIGLFAGKYIYGDKLILKNNVPFSISDLNENQISQIESINFNPETQQIALELNYNKGISVQGNLDKPEIQRILAKTLINDDRPNMRLKTVRALTKTKTLNEQLLDALIILIYKDENPGIRLKAMKILTSLSATGALSDLLAKVYVKVLLIEKNSAIRIEAFNGLNKITNMSSSTELISAVKEDTSEYIRTKASQILQRVEEPEIPK